ncbi:hypothetical protein [Pseudomonas putida]|uniref:hypothetical protein n=1 Tax=Pseudomonas putida TaxID=303 RepID=UPI00300EC0F4
MKRITARVRHGRRQQHISLPPSGLGHIGDGRAEDSGDPHPATEGGTRIENALSYTYNAEPRKVIASART